MTFICPDCNREVETLGEPGDKIYVVCQCGQSFLFSIGAVRNEYRKVKHEQETGNH